MSHTAGPWHYFYDGGLRSAGHSLYGGPQHDEHIATFETEEDARLCVAAPEMLAMLRELEPIVAADDYCYICKCATARHSPDCRLAALIAKVEGRS